MDRARKTSLSLMRLVMTSLTSREGVRPSTTRWTSAAGTGKLKTFLPSLCRDSIVSVTRFANSFTNFRDEISKILQYS